MIIQNGYTLDEKTAIEDAIHHAETYYLFGISEKGNMNAYAAGLSYIDLAEKHLFDADLLTVDEIKKFERRITSLRDDLLYQADIAHDTLFGYFPLIKLLNTSLFIDSASCTTYELVDDPDVIAVTTAVTVLADRMTSKFPLIPQIDVIVTSKPYNPALEGEALYIFNSYPMFYIHNSVEIASILTLEELELFKSGTITNTIKNKLMKEMGITNLLAVTIKEDDVVDSNYLYLVQEDIYNLSMDEPVHSTNILGFTRDRRSVLKPIITANILLLLLSLLLIPIASFISVKMLGSVRIQKNEIIKNMGTSLFVFLLGRILPWIIIPLVSTFMPAAENLVKLSFWWPVILGLSLTILPLAILRILFITLNKYKYFSFLFGKGGLLSAILGIGISAYLAAPLLMLHSQSGVYILVVVAANLVILFTVFGEALDRGSKFNIAFMIIPLLNFIYFGIILSLSKLYISVISLGITFISIGVSFLILYIHQNYSHHRIINESSSNPDKSKPLISSEIILKEFIDQIDRPTASTYLETKIYNDAIINLKSHFKKTNWLSFIGEAGIGKSAISRAVVQYVLNKYNSNDNEYLLLKGTCPEPSGAAVSYVPFQEAFSEHSGLKNLTDSGNVSQRLDNLLGNLVNSVIPISLESIIPNSDQETTSIGEIHKAVSDLIKKLSNKKHIILVIEDIHWIDNDSKELLKSLSVDFPLNGDSPITIILTSRDTAVLDECNISIENRFHINLLTKEKMIELLINKFNIANKSAITIVKAIGDIDKQKGNMYFFFHMLSSFVHSDVFSVSQNKIILKKQYSRINQLPISKELRQQIEELFDSDPEHKKILECAACIGFEFKASYISDSLNINRIDLLNQLDRIEKETGLIHDLRDEDDYYKFNSSFILQIIRDKIGITGKGPDNIEIPQLVREYHYRLALKSEKEYVIKKTQSLLNDVARHYYAAGKTHVNKAVKYCLDAAERSAEIYSYNQSFDFMNKATECNAFINNKDKYKYTQQTLSLYLQISLQSGLNVSSAVEKAVAYIERTEKNEYEPSILLKCIRIFYENAKETRDQLYFQKTVEICNLLLVSTEDPLLRAEAYLFLDISSVNRSSKANLERAQEILDGMKEDNVEKNNERLSLKAKILDSLGSAKGLNKDTVDDAIKLYNESINIKEMPQINDKRGLGFSYGGLARIYEAKGDFEKALVFYFKDLEISEQINDINSIATMYSHIGGCYISLGKYVEAQEYFIKAEEFNKITNSTVDKFFALIGLLRCAIALNSSEINEALNKFIKHVENEPKSINKYVIKSFLQENSQYKDLDWYRKLSSYT